MFKLIYLNQMYFLNCGFKKQQPDSLISWMQRRLHCHRKDLGLEAAQNSCSWDGASCYAKNEVFKLVEFRVFQYYYKNILCAYDSRKGVEGQVSQQKGK